VEEFVNEVPDYLVLLFPLRSVSFLFFGQNQKISGTVH
jgi:hypothetical protein